LNDCCVCCKVKNDSEAEHLGSKEPVGADAKGQTSLTFSFDMIAYTSDQGLYAGISAEGAGVITRAKWNEMYYERGTRPTDILVKHTVSNPGSEKLRAALAGAMQ